MAFGEQRGQEGVRGGLELGGGRKHRKDLLEESPKEQRKQAIWLWSTGAKAVMEERLIEERNV